MTQTTGTKGVVAITGGASGIGFSTAQILMARGWQPWLLDIKREALDAACKKLGIDVARGIVCNVADEMSIEQAFATLTAGNPAGDLVAVVNSAGIGVDKLSVDTSVEEFRHIVDVNLIGSFAVGRAAARYWLDRAISGSIVNISSVSGMCGNRGRSAYGASKGGVNLLTMVMANELGQSGIRVNAIAPGPVDTPLTQAVHTDNVRSQWHSRVPMHRYGTTHEIAAAVAFLVSDDASYVNGQVLAVDGGFMTAGLAV
ncbi:SDR family NAD(P)-dependent oxidoreductase [Brucellaceae bacterium D45D]